MAIFEKEDINTGRQTFLDIAKTLAICAMIFEHSVLTGVKNINNLSPLMQILTLLFIGGVFAAPVFMFAMGVGISYSHRSTPKYNLKRGLSLTLKAWGLNLIRYPLPAFILFKITQNTIFTDKLLYGLYSLDILQFAGLAFFMFAIFSFFKLSSRKVFIISIILAIIGSCFKEFNTGNQFTDIFVGHFMGIKSNDDFMACFPLFHWLIFVSGGYYFGGFLKRCISKDKFFAIALPISVIIFAGYLIYAIPHNFGMFSSDDAYYHMNIFDMIYTFSAIFLMLSICHFVSKITPEKILNICGSISKNINEIYIQQWIYICWFIRILSKEVLNITYSLPMLLLITIIILIVSEFGARFYKAKFISR